MALGSGPGYSTVWRRWASIPSRPQAPLAFVFSPLVGTPLTTSAKFAVVAKSPLTGMLTDALASSHFAIAGKRTGYDAIVIRGASTRPVVLLIDGDGSRLEDAGSLVGPERRGRRRRASRASRERLAGRINRPGRGARRSLRDGLPRRPPRRQGWARRCHGCQGPEGDSRPRRDQGGLVGPEGSGRGGTCLEQTLVRPCHRQVPGARHARQPARVQRHQHACRPATSKRRPSPRLLVSRPSSCPRLTGVVRSGCASCTIGCEHIYPGLGGKKVRVEYENVFALGPLCGSIRS